MTTLQRTTAPFDAVICLNGTLPPAEVFQHVADRPLIAADGAAAVLHAMGIVPEFIVGDLDSLPPDVLEQLQSLSEIIHDPDQDSNDFEKALRFASSMLWRRLLVTGLHGGDLEHTLNNWSVLMRHGRDLSLVALDRGRYGIPLYHSVTFAAQPGELLSLIPQPEARLTTQGLVWPLTNETLTLGTREGARNRAAEDRVEIIIHDGALFFFCDATLPLAPELTDGAILATPQTDISKES
jgi:thiamine pyrophosphokinase